MDKVLTVLNMLYDASMEAEYCSPNYVADFAHNRGIELDCDEVVSISNHYGEESCPTGRASELELN